MGWRIRAPEASQHPPAREAGPAWRRHAYPAPDIALVMPEI
ncbi:hypothetical protein [Dyella japonica]|nr:hypothetical protein [Dyella japonica]